jgi:hypothetical protein
LNALEKPLSVEDIIALEKWISAGANEAERALRLERARAHVFPNDLDPVETTRRIEIVERAKTEVRDRERHLEMSKDLPPPPPSPPTTAPSPPPPQRHPFSWEGLISPSSRAYRRSTQRDHIAEELDQMTLAAKGSPFDAED